MPEDVKARGLSKNVVVDTALRVADEEGLEALSLRRLARALDVTPMAIYRHVRNKSHLLDLMADRLLERIDLAAGAPAAWTERLRRLLGSYQAVAAEHPAAPHLLARPFSSPTALRISETLLEILHDARFDTAQAVRLLQLISGMLLGTPGARGSILRPLTLVRPRDRAPADNLRTKAERLGPRERARQPSRDSRFGDLRESSFSRVGLSGLEPLTSALSGGPGDRCSAVGDRQRGPRSSGGVARSVGSLTSRSTISPTRHHELISN
jgi:TetR/AcrR family transcriptional regulator, tetracycline repressor protein